jgi:drug/metabolite transporter (DMT)-like permease
MRHLLLTTLAMIAFAGNSLLCRLALGTTAIDAASFTTLRILSGAILLLVLVTLRDRRFRPAGDWPSALALFAYAAGFSFAYRDLSAAAGALLLFGAVQVTMIARARHSGERLGAWQSAGFSIAVAGLVGLLLPGLEAPPASGALLMLGAGVAWGIYTLRGRGSPDPTGATAGNFLRACLPALALSVVFGAETQLDATGAVYALVSGAVTSGLGYAIWYAALPAHSRASAAAVQLSVPALAAAGGVLLLGEPMSLRLWLASAAILGGIAAFIYGRQRQLPDAAH